MATTATIQKYCHVDGGYVEYIIIVLFQGKQWIIRKRYSDFRYFDNKMRENGFEIEENIPPKVIY